MINGMITVRSQSTRLPEKCFLPFGDGNVLEHIIRRAKFFEINPDYICHAALVGLFRNGSIDQEKLQQQLSPLNFNAEKMDPSLR